MKKVTVTPVGRESDKFMLRFPEGMRDRIAEAAKANGRSMNAEIVHRIEESFRLPGKVGQLLEAYRSIEAVHDEESDLTQRLIEMYEAQKALNDLQQGVIDKILSDSRRHEAPPSRPEEASPPSKPRGKRIVSRRPKKD